MEILGYNQPSELLQINLNLNVHVIEQSSSPCHLPNLFIFNISCSLTQCGSAWGLLIRLYESLGSGPRSCAVVAGPSRSEKEEEEL